MGRLRTHRAAAVAVALSAAAAGLGCARSAEERHLEALRDEIDRLQQDRDHANAAASRALDPEAVDPEAPAGGGSRASAPSLPPMPEALRLGADDDVAGDVADPEDPAPRPVIRVLGAAHPGGRGAWRGEDQVVQSVPSDGADSNGAQNGGRPSALDPEAKRAYDAALSLVNARQYPAALDALAAFLVKWPDHPYADNATYWRGECYFARGDYPRAAEQFEGVVTRFPLGNKAPDAMLKLGIVHLKMGDPSKAREVFSRLANVYPQSQAARRIPPVPAAAAPAVTPPGPAPEDHR